MEEALFYSALRSHAVYHMDTIVSQKQQALLNYTPIAVALTLPNNFTILQVTGECVGSERGRTSAIIRIPGSTVKSPKMFRKRCDLFRRILEEA